MPEETTTDSTATTSDATVQNTDTQTSGAGTDTAQQTQAQTEKTFTQADVDRIVQNRLKSAVKAELKKLTSDDEGKPNVEDLQRQLSEREMKLRSYEARQTIHEYLSDARHKLNLKPERMQTITKNILPDLEFDDEGRPTNIKDLIDDLKASDPALFANTPVSINAAAGRNGNLPVNDMDALIRRGAGYGS